MKAWGVVGVVVIAGAAAAAGYFGRDVFKPGPPPVDAREAALAAYAADLALVEPVSRRYTDAGLLAASTARIALSGPVAAMQAAQRDMRALKLGECMTTAQNFFVDSMQHSIDGYMAFMSKDETKSQQLMTGASIRANRANEQIDVCRRMAENIKPAA